MLTMQMQDLPNVYIVYYTFHSSFERILEMYLITTHGNWGVVGLILESQQRFRIPIFLTCMYRHSIKLCRIFIQLQIIVRNTFSNNYFHQISITLKKLTLSNA